MTILGEGGFRFLMQERPDRPKTNWRGAVKKESRLLPYCQITVVMVYLFIMECIVYREFRYKLRQ